MTSSTTGSSPGHVVALEELLAARRSCRGFLLDPVPAQVITRLLRIAQHSASWCNTQPWQVHVTRGSGTERIRSALTAADPSEPDFAFPEAYEGVYRDRRRACAIQLYDSVGVTMGDRAASAVEAEKNFELFGAPHVAVITTEAKLGVYGAVDCGLYVQAFLLAAQALGLGAVPQAAIAHRGDAVREELKLADHRLIVCGISFGYADHDHPSARFMTTRAGLDEAVSFID